MAFIVEEGILEDNRPFGSSKSWSESFGVPYTETTSRLTFQIMI